MTALTPAERLKLQQLRLREWIGRSGQGEDAEPAGASEHDHGDAASLPPNWTMTRGLDLHPWQRSACDAWFSEDHGGTIKVVTGAGKTVVALAIIERLQRLDPELRVAIVVPTIVLMNQWYEAIREHSNLPEHAVGRLGGGESDTFEVPTRILVAVLASASKQLPRLVDADLARHLLFVGDECHRVGAPEMSRVLETGRAYSLGLSATPERSEDVGGDSSDYEPQGFGPIVYEMSFAQAIEFDVLPPFKIDHFGLSLTASESRQYITLTNSITDARRELLNSSITARNAGGGERLLSWARRVSSRSGELAPLASRFVNDTTRRKQLLYRAKSRSDATVALVRDAIESRSDGRVIIFHESIREVVDLFVRLESEGLPTVMEHSELSGELRNKSLELFREGIAQVVVSARSLIEGFNVPEADLGIIAASSSSPRQRIQSIGRVLRRHRGSGGEEKASRIAVLYVRETVDESIYERQDWDKVIGIDRNAYFTWDPPSDPVQQDAPPRAAIPAEEDIDTEALDIGDEWPGRYDGEEFSSDALGNVSSLDGQIANNPQGIPERLHELRGRAGRFKVTPQRQAVLVSTPSEDRQWVTLFAGHLGEPFDFAAPPEPLRPPPGTLKPGDPYGGPLEPVTELKFRKLRSGVVARQRPRGEDFASGDQAETLVAVLRELNSTRGPISKFFVNELGHAFWRERGSAYFIFDQAGSLFPDDERRP